MYAAHHRENYQSGQALVVLADDGGYFVLWEQGTTCNSLGAYLFDGGAIMMTPSSGGNDAMVFDATVEFDGDDNIQVATVWGGQLRCPQSTAVRVASPTISDAMQLCVACEANPVDCDD